MASRLEFPDKLEWIDLTIAQSAALSDQKNLGGARPCAILTAAGWDSASIGFKVAHTDGGTFYPVYNSSGIIALTHANSVIIALDPIQFLHASLIKVWSHNAGSDVNQTTAARSLKLGVYPI